MRLARRALPALLLARPALAQGAPVAVASFSILGDLLAQVAGDRLALRVLAGPETDAHVFQPRPSDAEALRGARLVLRNGLGFEPWLDRLLRSTGTRAPVVTVTQGLTPRASGPGGAHGADAPDPHCWQDVRLAQHYVRRIAAALTEAERPGAAAFLARLDTLDDWVRARIDEVPPARRVLVTSHDSFGYFAAAYGVRVLPAQGVSTGAQPSAAAIAALVRRIRAEGLTAIFLDGPGAQPVLDRLAREAGVVPRGRLYADTLSRPDGPAPTYEAMVRHNVGLITTAMLG